MVKLSLLVSCGFIGALLSRHFFKENRKKAPSLRNEFERWERRVKRVRGYQKEYLFVFLWFPKGSYFFLDWRENNEEGETCWKTNRNRGKRKNS